MREIFFKAKTTKKEDRALQFNNVWVQGDLICSNNKYYIHPKGNVVRVDGELGKIIVMHEVDPSTICQCTGLKDKNGKLIWENDILSISKKMDSMGNYYFPPVKYPANVFVRWDLCAWLWETISKNQNGKYYISFPDAWCHYEAEVIGNIFDNPELINE